MVTAGEAGARVHECARHRAPNGQSTSLGAVGAALELARLAIEELRVALDEAARQHAETAAHLAWAMEFTGQCGVRDGRIVPRPPVVQSTARAAVPSIASTPIGLSTREREVLRLLVAGQSNRLIAHALCLSPRTVQRHVANVYLKIGAHCRAEATVYALQHGLA